eukprot:CCRYP_020701-RA/>CCRYP_020701-RA protein AED:0.01 eAED:0.01 QI:196/1/1/1/0/0/2/618/78
MMSDFYFHELRSQHRLLLVVSDSDGFNDPVSNITLVHLVDNGVILMYLDKTSQKHGISLHLFLLQDDFVEFCPRQLKR